MPNTCSTPSAFRASQRASAARIVTLLGDSGSQKKRWLPEDSQALPQSTAECTSRFPRPNAGPGRPTARSQARGSRLAEVGPGPHVGVVRQVHVLAAARADLDVQLHDLLTARALPLRLALLAPVHDRRGKPD